MIWFLINSWLIAQHCFPNLSVHCIVRKVAVITIYYYFSWKRSGLKSPTKSSVLTKHMAFTNKNSHEEHRRFVSPQRATLREATAKTGQTTSRNPLPSILKRPSVKRTSPQTKHSTKITKSIVWDKTVIDALVRLALYTSG